MSDRETIPNVIKCCLCATESNTEQELEDHISTWHINLCDRFQCEQCLKQQKQAKFSTEANLKIHMDQEHGIRQFWFRTWSSPETSENSAKIRQLIEQSLNRSQREISLPDQSQPMDEIVRETPPSSPRSTHNPRNYYSLDPCLAFSNAKIEVNVKEMDTKNGITSHSVRSGDVPIPVINISDSDESDNEGEEYNRAQQACATRSMKSQLSTSDTTSNSHPMPIVSERDQETNQSESQAVYIPRPMAKKLVPYVCIIIFGAVRSSTDDSQGP
ncbi:Zinc finger putative Transcription Factor family [Ditylenchus destructor]|uniref:Zinc finger putative Transcription Factor family n=1 Tax=Ditylenchus destructor TaxID=166010 RepID=A0AAD4MR04_9BILA|nr:Zinc finger putative Transcription Factor family [Ditylenchus destructor]